MELLFLYPRFLMLLLLVPFFIFVYFFSLAYNKKKAILFANFEAMERFYGLEFFSKNFLALYINIGILVLIVFALAGTSLAFNADTSSFSYVIAIDSSGSMAATDIIPTRLAAAKIEAKDFVDSLPLGVEVGLIGFSGDALVYQTLSTSKIKLKMAIDALTFGRIRGTNIYNALISANKLFKGRQLKSVILLSDGQLNIGSAPQVIKYANQNNLLVNTIALGTKAGGNMGFGTVSKVDEDFLKSLAMNTGGKFFRVKNSEDMKNSFNSLVHGTYKKVKIDLTFYLLITAIALFTTLWILYSLRFKVIP